MCQQPKSGVYTQESALKVSINIFTEHVVPIARYILVYNFRS